jgi:hypothetical protein
MLKTLEEKSQAQGVGIVWRLLVTHLGAHMADWLNAAAAARPMPARAAGARGARVTWADSWRQAIRANRCMFGLIIRLKR